MYLSKCVLNTSRPINSYQLHREIWKLFPDRPDDKRDYLFRVENLGQKAPQQILLQSLTRPMANKRKLLMLSQPKKVALQIRSGQMLRFMIRANPTKRIKEENKTGNQGRVRVPIIDEDEMNKWLQRQLKNAAIIHEIMINGQNIMYFRKGTDTGKIVAITYSGLLEIKNEKKLLSIIEKGVGPAKAFGCGLLSLARA